MLPTHSEFERFVANEDRLIAELIVRHIIHDSWVCPFGRAHGPCLPSRNFRCRCNRQDHKKSLFYGSIFDTSKLSPAEVLSIAYEWLSDSSVSSTARRTGHARYTVSRFYGYFRQIASSMVEYSQVKLGGLGVIVQIDETIIRKDKETGKDIWVVGAIEKSTEQKVHIGILRSKSTKDIISALSNSIRPGSFLVADFMPSYAEVSRRLKCQLVRVNKSRTRIDKSTRMNTNTIEGLWPILHKFDKARKGIPLQDILDEFTWRRIYRKDMFEHFLKGLGSIEWNFNNKQ
jgi:hypothetical protein